MAFKLGDIRVVEHLMYEIEINNWKLVSESHGRIVIEIENRVYEFNKVHIHMEGVGLVETDELEVTGVGTVIHRKPF